MSACLTLMASIELLDFCFFLYFPIPGPFACTKLSFLESKSLIFIEFSRTFQIALIAHSVRDQPIPQNLSHLTISDTFHMLNYSYSYKFYFHLNQKLNYLILIHRKIKNQEILIGQKVKPNGIGGGFSAVCKPSAQFI